jgi:hypothetical protein
MVFGQKNSMSHPRTKAIKLNFIAGETNLSNSEENTFWNIYDRYEDEVFKICRKPLYQLRKQLRSKQKSLAAEEIKSIILKMDSLEVLMLNKKRERNEALLAKLPAEKVLEIFNAERKFNYQVIGKLHKKSEEVASNPNKN